jgi:ACS family D-galactonate transporter-like MFS transporter
MGRPARLNGAEYMSESASEVPATQVRRLILALLMGFTFLAHFNRVSMSVAGSEKLIGPDGLTKIQMGWIYSAFLIVYTLLMLPGGRIIDRFGPRLALTGMGLGTGLCVVLTGVLGYAGLAIASLWLPLLFIRGMAGAFSVPLHPAAARSVSFWIPLTSRTAANGLVTAGALIGISFSYPIYGRLMDSLGWPLAFIVCGAAMMVYAVVWWFLSSDVPSLHSWANAAERRMVTSTNRRSSESNASVHDFLDLLRNKRLMLLTLSYGALSYLQYLFFYWTSYYFESELHLPVAESRSASFTVTMAMAVGMTAGGAVTDVLCRSWGRRWGCRAIAMCGMGLCALFAWEGVAAKDPQRVTLLFSVALGSLGLCEGIFWTTAPLLDDKNAGLACAFLNTLGNAVGLLAPIFTPWIGESYGWTRAIEVACVICGLGALFWLWIDPVESHDPSEAVTSPT